VARFHYRAVTLTGEVIAGEVDAPSRDEIVRRIEHLGHLLIDASPTTSGIFGKGGRFGQGTPGYGETTMFLRQLTLLVGAGLTLEAALQTLGDDCTKAVAGVAPSQRSSISAGMCFSEALERHP